VEERLYLRSKRHNVRANKRGQAHTPSRVAGLNHKSTGKMCGM